MQSSFESVDAATFGSMLHNQAHSGNIRIMDIAADSASLDSLSFADLVCISDRGVKPPPATGVPKISKEDMEFEFGTLRQQDFGKFSPAEEMNR